jgi:hypothetical protein
MLSNRRPMIEPEFAAFLRAREERWELIGGEPVMMAPTTQRHANIVANILATIHRQLRGTRCRPTYSKTGVRTGAGTIRFPDLVVDCGPREDQAMCATAPVLACDVLIALGYATDAPRGARLLPSPVPPNVLPRWDDACCVVLSVAEQLCQIRLRHSWSGPDDETGPSSAHPETSVLLNLLGLTSHGVWTDAATVVLWRTAPDEVPPPTDEAFSAQVDRAVTDIPDAIRAQIHTIYAEHDHQSVRDYLVDWMLFEGWRWGDGWLTNDSQGSLLGVFHDPLAQRIREAVMARLMEI